MLLLLVLGLELGLRLVPGLWQAALRLVVFPPLARVPWGLVPWGLVLLVTLQQQQAGDCTNPPPPHPSQDSERPSGPA